LADLSQIIDQVHRHAVQASRPSRAVHQFRQRRQQLAGRINAAKLVCHLLGFYQRIDAA